LLAPISHIIDVASRHFLTARHCAAAAHAKFFLHIERGLINIHTETAAVIGGSTLASCKGVGNSELRW